MVKNGEVNIDFYKLLEDSEVQASMLYGLNKEARLIALVDFTKLQELADILGYNYFGDGVEVTMMNGYIAIRVDEIITEWFEHETEFYQNAIGELGYRQYLKYKKWKTNEHNK